MTCQCNRCGKKWESLVALPKKCRHCGSQLWNKARVRKVSAVRKESVIEMYKTVQKEFRFTDVTPLNALLFAEILSAHAKPGTIKCFCFYCVVARKVWDDLPL